MNWCREGGWSWSILVFTWPSARDRPCGAVWPTGPQSSQGNGRSGANLGAPDRPRHQIGEESTNFDLLVNFDLGPIFPVLWAPRPGMGRGAPDRGTGPIFRLTKSCSGPSDQKKILVQKSGGIFRRLASNFKRGGSRRL